MKILQSNNYNPSLNFQSAYPVVHRVVTANGTYIPMSDFKEVKKMQSKLVRVLNSSWEKIFSSLDKEAQQNVQRWIQYKSSNAGKTTLKLPKTEKEALAIFRGLMGFYDLDYAYAPKPQPKPNQKGKINSEQRVRSFYNRERSLIDGRYYLAYMISGKDIKPFEDDLAKNIGKIKHETHNPAENEYPQEVKDAVDLYNKNGLEFVNDPRYRFKSKKDGKTYVLQANFQPMLNKLGKIKDYKFISAKFVPEYKK